MYSRVMGGGSNGHDIMGGGTHNKRQRLDHHHHHLGSTYFSGSPVAPGAFNLYGGFFGGGGGGGGGLGLPVVRLRGLPFNCTESDVLDFLAGLEVIDVLLTHKQGRFSGEAYCVLSSPIQSDLALQRHKENMGRRYIEVFRSKKQDYYNAVAAEVNAQGINKAAEKEKERNSNSNPNPNLSTNPPPPSSEKDHLEHTGVLKLRGLPYSANKREILDFFEDQELVEDNVHIVMFPDGRASGEAYVEFKGPLESKAAMRKDKMMLGSRYVELFPSSREEALKASSK